MKYLILFLALGLFPYKALALTFEVQDPCSGKVVYQKNLEGHHGNVGQLTLSQLEDWGIDFIGSELGIHTMLGTPVGDEALEIINRLEMRSYGWCYQVDGFIPEVLPPYFELNNSHKRVVWFFGFAHYKAGEWVSQCEKVSDTQPAFICAK
jgi:hypothetical protein